MFYWTAGLFQIENGSTYHSECSYRVELRPKTSLGSEGTVPKRGDNEAQRGSLLPLESRSWLVVDPGSDLVLCWECTLEARLWSKTNRARRRGITTHKKVMQVQIKTKPALCGNV